jgi:hypothetical protein
VERRFFRSWQAGCLSDQGLFNEFPPEPQVNPPDLANPTQTDVIVQVTTPMVDILWTIDNSCSMSDEQLALTDNFPKFMDYFLGSGLDYHIGVTSTDMDDLTHKGKLQDGGTPYKYIRHRHAERDRRVHVHGEHGHHRLGHTSAAWAPRTTRSKRTKTRSTPVSSVTKPRSTPSCCPTRPT